jgi:hypothetical protein
VAQLYPQALGSCSLPLTTRRAVPVKLLPWKYACFLSRYLATAIIYLLISLSLPSNGSTCRITIYKNLHLRMYGVGIASNCILFIRLSVNIGQFPQKWTRVSQQAETYTEAVVTSLA